MRHTPQWSSDASNASSCCLLESTSPLLPIAPCSHAAGTVVSAAVIYWPQMNVARPSSGAPYSRARLGQFITGRRYMKRSLLIVAADRVPRDGDRIHALGTSNYEPGGASGGTGARGSRAPTGRGGGGGSQKDSAINAGVDWTKQPSVLPKRPADELKEFVLPAGYHLELVLADPEISDPTAIMFDGNGRMFVLENPRLHGRQGGERRARAGGPHLPLVRHGQRRRVRQAHGLRRPPRLPAIRHAIRTEQRS